MADILLHTPSHWSDYELIDSGGLEKLERFGKYILTRPEPQAVWQKSLSEQEWNKRSHAIYKRVRGVDPSKSQQAEKGEWQRKPNMPDQWTIHYASDYLNLQFRLGLTSFGHVGIFPEQASNWEYLIGQMKRFEVSSAKNQVPGFKSELRSVKNRHLESSLPHLASTFRILNLFAYTGAASLAAKSAGADVVHVDSVKQVINWAKEDMELSGLKDIRWVVEDALKFVRREVKRGNKYNGIILDPPAYGRGPEGEKWVLEELVNEMIALCSELLEEKDGFFILSLYSMGFSPLISESLVRTHFGVVDDLELGELYFPDHAGRRLPLGTYLRFRR